MTTEYENLVNLIVRAGSCINFGPFGFGVSEEWIDVRERELGIPLPHSYKWWLRNYGGGEVQGEEIYSIYEIPISQVMGGDIVAMTLRQNGLAQDKIYITQANSDEEYYFKPSAIDENGEYPVYLRDLINDEESRYADSFADFLAKRVHFWCG